MTQLDMGKDLRDNMLRQTREGREERIERVRLHLWTRWSWACATVRQANCLTADDVWEAANALGFTDGDTRWLGNVTKGWALVEHTGRYVPSRLKQRHARPIPVFRWV